jgi:hypothetical protein
MDIFLGSIYSFDEKAKDGTPCVRGCGNEFRLVKLDINSTAFRQDSKEIRFTFLCCRCGNEVELRLIADDDKVSTIFAEDEDRVDGIHFSFFANIPLNFDYANEGKRLYMCEERKEVKKPINPNRIFRERKKNNGIVVEYIKRDSGSLTEYSKSMAKALKESQIQQKRYNKKYESLAKNYVRPEDMSEELIDLTIPDELIPKPEWKDGKAIDWQALKLDWTDQLGTEKVIIAQQGETKEVKGYEPSDWGYDEFYDNDTSTR